jgi:hypothetical protein
MTVQLDNLGPQEKRQYVLVGVTVGLVLALVSTVLRTWAKLISTKRLQGEDYFMFAALFLCTGTASCMFYGQLCELPAHYEFNLTRSTRVDNWLGTTPEHSDQTSNKEVPDRKAAIPEIIPDLDLRENGY